MPSFFICDVEHFDGDANFLQCAAATGELFRVKHIGGLIDEITGEQDALRYRAACGKRFFRGGKIGDGDDDLDLALGSSSSLRLVL